MKATELFEIIKITSLKFNLSLKHYKAARSIITGLYNKISAQLQPFKCRKIKFLRPNEMNDEIVAMFDRCQFNRRCEGNSLMLFKGERR